MTWPKLARSALIAAVVVLAVTAQLQVWSNPPAYDTGGRLLNAALAAAYTFPLMLARRWPLAVLVVVLAAISVDYVLGGQGGQQWFAVLIAVYGVGAYATRTAATVGLALVAIVVLAVDLPRLQDGDPLDEVLPAWFVLAGAWGLGAWTQHRRSAMTALTEQAEALARDRDEATRAAVAYERARIARELHDLVAHSMAIMVLQAQAGSRVIEADVEAAKRAFDAIETSGREGMTELRRLLDVLLVDPDPEGVDPRPGLAQVERLAARVGEAGLPVEFAVSGESRPLPPGVDVSAYRIVQEALTNSLKHAGPARAQVRVAYRPGEVELSIVDDGARVPKPESEWRRPGQGLIGMRERAHLFGGSLEAGPSPTGGFRVRAVLPTEAG